jgi:cell division protein FtsB
MAELKVEDAPGLVRDTASNAIINKDRKAYQEFKARRRVQKAKDAELEELKNEVNELKELVKSLVKPKTTRSKTKSE